MNVFIQVAIHISLFKDCSQQLELLEELPLRTLVLQVHILLGHA